MRAISIIVVVLGLASLVYGILIVAGAGSAESEVAESIAPLTLAELDAKYEEVKAKQATIKMAEEPQIQAGTAEPSAMYNYLTIQKTGLGLARSNVGMAQATRINGTIDIIVGLGLAMAGLGLLRKIQSDVEHG